MHPILQRIKRLLPYFLMLVCASGGYGLGTLKTKQAAPIGAGSPLAHWQRIDAQGSSGSTQFLVTPGEAAGTQALVFPDSVYTLTPVSKAKPGPKPNPNPNPAPVGTAAYLYFVTESVELTPDLAAVKDSNAWRSAADKARIRWSVMDHDAAAKLYPNVVQRAEKLGLPAIVLLDKQGAILTGSTSLRGQTRDAGLAALLNAITVYGAP